MSINKRKEEKKLEQQMEWCNQKEHLLEKINENLEEVRAIAVYAVEEELTSKERQELNAQLRHLKAEVDFLQRQMQPVTH